MHKNVEVLIGRLATNRELLDRFAEEPFAALREEGLELTDTEVAAIAALAPAAIRAFAGALDSRLRKAALGVDHPARPATTAGTPGVPDLEIPR